MDRWDYSDIPEQEGRIAIVTGANSGLGFYTVKGLAAKKCHVIMACRNEEKGEKAKQELLEELPDASLELMMLDLASLESVKEFVKEFKAHYKRLDLLINNAGLMSIPYRKTEEGFEMQFGVNHLGHFALSALLFDLLKNTSGARLVNVASLAHRIGEIRFDDIHWEKGYNKWKAYGMSKLANLLFTYELADRVSNLGLDVRVLAAHPGYADSRLIEKGPEMQGRSFLIRAARSANRLFAQSTEKGALPTLMAACSKTALHRGYYGPGGPGELRGYPIRTYPVAKKISKEHQEKLWNLSEELTGINFDL